MSNCINKLKYYNEMCFETSNKLYKIWLKELNSHIYIIERLNLFKVWNGD